jgi:hypothetical protein
MRTKMHAEYIKMATRKIVASKKRSTRSSRKQSGGFPDIFGFLGLSNSAVKNTGSVPTNDASAPVAAPVAAVEGEQTGGKRRRKKRGAK